jgi:DNA-binding transcriptional LysR family regulator
MRFNKFDLNLLVALDALLAERSVTRAATRLHLSPSATSDALARLREYFDDELLVQVGRRMEPTPRAESLKQAVRDMLVRIDSTITAQPTFDPAHSDRRFRIFASDYTQFVLGPAVMTLSAQERCRATMDFLPQVSQPHRDLERGEADLLILPTELISPDHPHEVLFSERFVCVVWSEGPLARGLLSAERYALASHVVMRPPSARGEQSYEESQICRQGVERHVAATSYGFVTVPGLVVGTSHIATMHESLALTLARLWPLAIRPCPIDIPPMTQAMQWHSYRSLDPGMVWLRGIVQKAARHMNGSID